MTDRVLVEQVVRFAFLIRLASLLLVVLLPGEAIDSAVGLSAIGFITVTSTVGLYSTNLLTRKVAAHPILLVVDVLIAALIAAVLGSQSPIILYSLSTAVLIGILLTPRFAAAVMAVLISAYLLITIEQGESVTVMAALLVPITYATVGALGSLTRALHIAAMREQGRARMLSEAAARERERGRLAREMHDSVAKSLHGIGLAAASLSAWAEHQPEVLAEKARELQDAAESASQDARAILFDLRVDADDRTLAQQLRTLSSDLEQGGLPTSLTVEGVGDCDHVIKRELVAIAAEAVENVRRHSGACAVEIDCSGDCKHIMLSVRDDGVGFDPRHTPDDHFGVVGMHERAQTIGATLDITSAPGNGTLVTIRAPRTAKANTNGSLRGAR
ncbi:sensor histidine kinase [Aeromicrobium sp.]|uniref:sensor histidine kinase n=1 Tax=Aeromicrobium sp. TaxID=1871063 RepID=UPI003D6A9B6E